MAQYEAALKSAMSAATSTTTTTTTTATTMAMETPKQDLLYNDATFLRQLDQQKEAMEQYEAALRAFSNPAETTNDAHASFNHVMEAEQMKAENVEKTREFLQAVSRDIMSKAKTQATIALAYTKQQLQDEQDLSDVSKNIMKQMEAKASQVQHDIQYAPYEVLSTIQKTVESDDFKTLPNRTIKAFQEFFGSEEVKVVSKKTIEAIKDGLESDEMKALKEKASRIVKETLQSKN
jgi:hypothetical protein